MVPTVWIEVDALPKTPNLKIDRKALAEPVEGKGAAEPATADVPAGQGNGSASGGDLLERIRIVWQEELGTEDVGPDDNFFDLGGHSLLVVQVHLRIKEELGADINITDLFQYPTVRSLANHLDASSDKAADEGASSSGDAET